MSHHLLYDSDMDKKSYLPQNCGMSLFVQALTPRQFIRILGTDFGNYVSHKTVGCNFFIHAILLGSDEEFPFIENLNSKAV